MWCAINFRGTGKRMDVEGEEGVVRRPCRRRLPENAWVDNAYCMSWAKHCLGKSLMEGRDGVPAEDSLLTLDSLRGQRTGTFKAYIKK